MGAIATACELTGGCCFSPEHYIYLVGACVRACVRGSVGRSVGVQRVTQQPATTLGCGYHRVYSQLLFVLSLLFVLWLSFIFLLSLSLILILVAVLSLLFMLCLG